jgi:hypothetical protein
MRPRDELELRLVLGPHKNLRHRHARRRPRLLQKRPPEAQRSFGRRRRPPCAAPRGDTRGKRERETRGGRDRDSTLPLAGDGTGAWVRMMDRTLACGTPHRG